MSSELPLQPLGGNILVKPEGQEETTASGLVIAATSKAEKPQIGVVLALGTGKKDKEGKELAWNVKVGDRVIFKKYSPDEVEVDGEDYLVMSEEDVLAVFTK